MNSKNETILIHYNKTETGLKFDTWLSAYAGWEDT